MRALRNPLAVGQPHLELRLHGVRGNERHVHAWSLLNASELYIHMYFHVCIYTVHQWQWNYMYMYIHKHCVHVNNSGELTNVEAQNPTTSIFPSSVA